VSNALETPGRPRPGVLRGLTAQEIADDRSVTVSTIENQIRSLYQKLEVADRAQLTRTLLSVSRE
jgi:DNA-binding NarL/FixJ family response regulator